MKYVIGLLSVVLWGLTFVFTKELLNYMTPFEIVFYRYLISGLFYLSIMKRSKWTRDEITRMIVAAFLGIALYSVLANYSLKYLSAALAGVLNGAIPLLTILGERFFRKTKLTTKIYIAFGISFAGILMLTSQDGNSESTVFGAVLMLIALIAWVIFTFMNERLFNNHSDVEILCYESLIGSMMVSPFVFNSKLAIERQVLLLGQPSVLIYLLILGVVISGVGYMCYMYGLRHLGVSFMSFVMNLLPGISVLCAFLILHESISLLDIGGLILVATSVIIAKQRETDLLL